MADEDDDETTVPAEEALEQTEDAPPVKGYSVPPAPEDEDQA